MNGGKPDLAGYAYATVRIRLPEGLVLQGEFNAGTNPTRIACMTIPICQCWQLHVAGCIG